MAPDLGAGGGIGYAASAQLTVPTHSRSVLAIEEPHQTHHVTAGERRDGMKAEWLIGDATKLACLVAQLGQVGQGIAFCAFSPVPIARGARRS